MIAPSYSRILMRTDVGHQLNYHRPINLFIGSDYVVGPHQMRINSPDNNQLSFNHRNKIINIDALC